MKPLIKLKKIISIFSLAALLMNTFLSFSNLVIAEGESSDIKVSEIIIPTPEVSPEVTPEVTPTPAVSITPTPEISPSITPTPQISPTVTPSVSPSPIPSPSDSPTPSPTVPQETPAIKIEKTGVKKLINQDDTPEFIFNITNTGNTPLTNIIVTDDKCSNIKLDSGDTNSNNILETTEKFEYTCKSSDSLKDISTNYTNTASVSGKYEDVTVRDGGSFTYYPINITKVVKYSDGSLVEDNKDTFNIEIKSGSDVLLSDSISIADPVKFFVAAGSYKVCEKNLSSKYINNGCTSFTNENSSVDLINTLKPVVVNAYKVICNNESDLPNWALGNNPTKITQDVVNNFISQKEGKCYLAKGWDFQWGYDDIEGKLGVDKLIGDTVGKADGVASNCGLGCGSNTNSGSNYNDWKDFDTSSDGSTPATVSIAKRDGTYNLWVREVLKENYLPFTYPPKGGTEDDISAEIYCHYDVNNFDNYDRVDNIDYGGEYTCVAFNVKLPVISGTKFEDLNQNREFDENEKGIPDVKIYLDSNKNSVWDANEKFVTTNSNGEYIFNNLEFKEYTICEVIPEGWEQTYPNSDNEENSSCHTIKLDGEESNINFGNYHLNPILHISKYNSTDNGLVEIKAGDSVTYTLKVKVGESNAENVIVTDLPPLGFVVDTSSFSVTSNLQGDITSEVPDPHYASPGDWKLGNLSQGEEVTIKYSVKTKDTLESGTFKDLAYGYSDSIANLAYADDGFIDTNIVGTQVKVNNPGISPKASADINKKKEIKEEGSVLGASDSLPGTGFSTNFILILVSLMLISLTGLLAMLFKSKNKLFSVLVIFAFLLIPLKASAANLYVRIQDPKDFKNSDFTISYTVIDMTNSGNVTVECYKKLSSASDFSLFQTKNLIPGGTSDKCDINNSVVTETGEYKFYVKAISNSENSSSSTITVNIDRNGPSKPKDFDVDKQNSCKYDLSFKTANDGQTSYVEVYRSHNSEFSVNESTRVKSINIGPDTKIEYSDTMSGDNCGTNYYAIRAFDSAGNYSDVVSQPDVKIIETKKTETSTSTNSSNNSNSALVSSSSNIIGSTTSGNKESEVVTQKENEKTAIDNNSEKNNADKETSNTGDIKGASDTNFGNILKQDALPIVSISALLLLILGFILFLRKK